MNTINSTFEMTPDKKRFSINDSIWALFVIAGAFYAWLSFGHIMDAYEDGILVGSAIGLIMLGRFWPSAKTLSYAVATLSLFALWTYAQHNNQISANEQAFFLKFLISSQSAFMWMSALFVLSTLGYFAGLFFKSDFTAKIASVLAWSGATFGLVGMMVRWRESYLINPEYGHIPVSSLYEVFILFAVLTTLMYLYYEQKIRTRSMGGFVMLIVSAAVGFLLWYTFDRGAHEIQPLVPALKSYWMKIHVPANFIGYGGFSIAAMVGLAYVLTEKIQTKNPQSRFLRAMPSLESMDDLMYKTIALGFAFFTIATVLGAMWAAEAWGGYWSWDPKETWALIVWLNYAAWLHIRMSKGWRGRPMALWAVIGLVVTVFAFLGVNMFLSGLHSYGEL
ncbi:MAG: c-type cytochrome biogenesis protein CcsB [Piscirickettsiaceae bacterium CG_4_9_14_3_um_filter_43_564]|nr:c-type cytochrome biogenesis protein CcsB [Thiomicrospira sp.]OIP94851.1 MAG: c-type cytochrome biogenesis protein CcsB [Thiomicrospira sp. CG2_30_44_34]PIQ05946.1 MAG: c-type cytochrome biogenesis protein CcsB [Piscirickettsiaceae bacterium CG18_big_fil_WC_8_21_14_2_50_44_103]PIU37715.1 MAG: c-type cytochrome biogenesis protein CcsB [Piscirickettsiaceae bacterium CG07_land_8_20_14_0_80_44_28]PIW56921.1 MAG: c-type cytochrome biogenesis protein CcsB [Piscirickettsiaceae bacterium CG12_big_fi